MDSEATAGDHTGVHTGASFELTTRSRNWPSPGMTSSTMLAS